MVYKKTNKNTNTLVSAHLVWNQETERVKNRMSYIADSDLKKNVLHTILF